MERELTLERGQLGRIGGRKRQLTDSKIASAKKLLATGASPTTSNKKLAGKEARR